MYVILQISYLFTYLNLYIFIKGIKLFRDSAAFVGVEDELKPHKQRLSTNKLKRKNHGCSSSRLANELYCHKHTVGFNLRFSAAC